MNEQSSVLTAKPICSQYVYARRMGSNETLMMTVDEAQRRGYLVFDYGSRTYRPLDTLSASALKLVPTPASVKD